MTPLPSGSAERADVDGRVPGQLKFRDEKASDPSSVNLENTQLMPGGWSTPDRDAGVRIRRDLIWLGVGDELSARQQRSFVSIFFEAMPGHSGQFAKREHCIVCI